jgi:hypothetical protein
LGSTTAGIEMLTPGMGPATVGDSGFSLFSLLTHAAVKTTGKSNSRDTDFMSKLRPEMGNSLTIGATVRKLQSELAATPGR